jgi:hypothetical protein
MRKLLGIPASVLRVSARVLLVAMSVSALGPAAHEIHEDDCEPIFVLHDESQHHVQSRTSPDDELPGDHCVACHFARASRGPVSWERTGLSALDAGVLLYHSDGELRAAPSSAPLPARAPPALA